MAIKAPLCKGSCREAAEGLFVKESSARYNPSVTASRATSLCTREALSRFGGEQGKDIRRLPPRGGSAEGGEGACVRKQKVTQGFQNNARALLQSRICSTAPSWREPLKVRLQGDVSGTSRSGIVTPSPSPSAPPRLTAVRSRLGSDSHLDCHSLPRRRFTTHGEAW